MTPTWPRNVHVAAALSTLDSGLPKVVTSSNCLGAFSFLSGSRVAHLGRPTIWQATWTRLQSFFMARAIVSSISYAIKFKYTCDKNQILLDI